MTETRQCLRKAVDIIKRMIILAAVCAIIFTTSGCSDQTELGNRAIIQALSIDYNGEYRLSALLFSSGGSGGDTLDASLENVICIESKGATIADAIDNLSLTDGKEIYMSEAKLLVLGGGFEEFSAADALSTLYFDMRCSLNMAVCCADEAAAITSLQFTEGLTSAEKPLSIIENAYKKGVSPKTTLLDLLCDSVSGSSSLIPMLEIAENGRGVTSSDDGKTAILCGSRCFVNGELSEFYDSDDTESLMLLSGKSHEITLNYIHDNTEKTCQAYCIKVKKEDKGVTVSAKFHARDGGTLSEDERAAALYALGKIVERAL